MSPAWQPTAEYLARSRLRALAERCGCGDAGSFQRWSVNEPEAFWRATERDLGIVWSAPYTAVHDASRGPAWTTWWTSGRLNYVATALRHEPGRAAVIAES